MDTSKENIIMLEKAHEIQALWKPKVGDWFLNDYHGTTGFNRETEKIIWGDDVEKWELIQCLTSASSIKDYVTISDSSTGTAHTYTMEEFFKHRHVWLPRQDQLQDMIKVHIISDVKECIEDCELMDDVDDIRHTTYHNFKSLEMFWLAYVMDKKYGKRWDGTDWVV